jgi:hypothetical protein
MIMNSIQDQASYLVDLWNRLSSQHIALGCSCNMTGISVTLEDFERDIADYLLSEGERFKQAEVVKFLTINGPLEKQTKPVRSILERLMTGYQENEVANWLLQRLTKTLESYANLHSPQPEALLMGGSRSWGSAYRQ